MELGEKEALDAAVEEKIADVEASAAAEDVPVAPVKKPKAVKTKK